MLTEAQEQTKILKWLKDNDFVATKFQATSAQAGWADIIACSPNGTFVAIEVKKKDGKATVLQKEFIKKFQRRGALAMIVYGYDDFIDKMEKMSWIALT